MQIFQIIFSLIGIYQFVISLGALKELKHPKVNDKNHRFAILICARNEENVISQSIESILNVNYPKDLYDIYVVINNTTDHTEQIVKNYPVSIINFGFTYSKKGEVIDYALEKILKNEKYYDAFVFFDADNLVDSNILNAYNDALNANIEIGTSNRQALNPYENWLSSSYNIYFHIGNVFLSKARNAYGLSAYLGGTGMLIKRNVIEESGGYKTIGVTEDVEFSHLQILKHHKKVCYIEDAILYDEQPTSFKQSIYQRERWSNGNMQTFHRFFFDYFKEISWQNLDSFLFGSTVLFQVILTIFSLISIFTSKDIGKSTLLYFLSSYLSTTVIAGYTLFLQKRLSVKDIKGILTFYFFIFSWFFINVECLLFPSNHWEPIKHKGVTHD